MADYYLLKLIHILSAVVMAGTGTGLAFFLLLAVLSKQPLVIKSITRWVILGDWLFTTPAIIAQITSGVLLASRLGWSYQSEGSQWVIGLYALVLSCWVPVVVIQYKLNALSVHHLDATFRRYFIGWFSLGCVAFTCVLALFFIMIFKPFSFYSP